ncbi:P-loop containing nucleoside triphosphate hydrolase protein [Aspergillus sergii]|uniref:P-loop containing nucleoside triphosphate hydrolase protein n=1 Tax=Aspergillus sergii TaxID=1034303 RepID=A0A5N6WJX4_9EURO|nr:P-loop containing nucleoside triphosphate hydrolase protein [Aspergillus sergii]
MGFPEAIVEWVTWPFRTIEFRVNLLGDHDCGKTTLLYQMKLGELVNTIPTIGFNVETVEYPRKYRWTIWDMSMSRSVEQLIHSYFPVPDIVLFIHNCDPQQPEPIYDFQYFIDFINKHGCKHMWILLNKQDTLPPERAPVIVDGLRKMYEKEMAKYDQLSWRILDHKLSAKTGEGVQEILHQLHSSANLLLRTRPKPQPQPRAEPEQDPEPNPAPEIAEDTVSSPRLSKPIDRKASQNSVNAQTFWNSFVTGDIPVWDHHVHLKVTYILVLEYVKQRRSTFAMADTMIAHLRRLRNSQPEKFGNREHRPRAWDSWVPPDRQPLPVLTSALDMPATLSTLQGDPIRLIRFAFVFIRQCKHISESCGEDAVRQALATLQSTTIRLRASNKGIPPFSETQARFWLHMVRTCLQSLELAQTGDKEILPSQLSFDDFVALFDLTPTSWKRYYSQRTWDSLAARVQFVPPDRRALPNVMNISTHRHEVEAIIKGIEKEVLPPELGSLEDVLLATWAESVEPPGKNEQRVDVDAYLSCCDDNFNYNKVDLDD